MELSEARLDLHCLFVRKRAFVIKPRNWKMPRD
jgi:hypothetical protein